MVDARFLILALVLNVCLWVVYALMGVRTSDFGGVPEYLRMYLVVTAIMAYLATVVWIVLFSSHQTSDGDAAVVTACMSLYFGLQIAFLPVSRAAQLDRSFVDLMRSLLVACAVPVGHMAAVGSRYDGRLAMLGWGVFAHVFVNDALVYGFLF